MTYKRGSRDEIVKQIQKALCGAGYHVGVIDGIFGQMTEDAVLMFQKATGLTADGIVGPATLAKLIPNRFKKSRRNITKIIIHCSATPEGEDKTVADIRKDHKAQGWSDIGYHYVVYRNGHVEPGRDVDIIGAHCDGHNTHSIGVVYVGGLAKDGKTAKDTRTEEQKAAMLCLLMDLKKIYPKARIHGHRDFARKDCPCFDAAREYRNV